MVILNDKIISQLNFLFPEREFDKNSKDDIIKTLESEALILINQKYDDLNCSEFLIYLSNFEIEKNIVKKVSKEVVTTLLDKIVSFSKDNSIKRLIKNNDIEKYLSICFVDTIEPIVRKDWRQQIYKQYNPVTVSERDILFDATMDEEKKKIYLFIFLIIFKNVYNHQDNYDRIGKENKETFLHRQVKVHKTEYLDMYFESFCRIFYDKYIYRSCYENIRNCSFNDICLFLYELRQKSIVA